MRFTRREFVNGVGALGACILTSGRASFASEGPISNMPRVRSTFGGVPVGCSTRSLLSLPLDGAIRVIADIGYGMAELHPKHVEPVTAGRAATDEAARMRLREWRLGVPLEQFEEIGRKFKKAGLFLYAYNMNWADNVTDEEIDRGFQMTKALGCRVMSAVGSKQLLRRLNPFAQEHRIWIGAHNDIVNLPTIADFDDLLKGSSSYMQMTLDIGHFVASGSSPLACLKTHHSKIINLHLKDRKKAGGPDMPFGEGDTPIAEVLRINRDGKYRIPANVEWEARDSDPVASLRTCLEYCKRVLQSDLNRSGSSQ
jgi:sugar phosphate isomerase/epimerase